MRLRHFFILSFVFLLLPFSNPGFFHSPSFAEETSLEDSPENTTHENTTHENTTHENTTHENSTHENTKDPEDPTPEDSEDSEETSDKPDMEVSGSSKSSAGFKPDDSKSKEPPVVKIPPKPTYTLEDIAPQYRAYAQELIQKANEKKLWDERLWYLLVHYETDFFGDPFSYASQHFFNHKEGASSPQLEMEGTILSFFADNPPDRQHPQCQFVDRYTWISKELQIDPKRFKQYYCKDFIDWLNRINGDSVSLVFSSYYINNPSSVFGHTLIRVNNRKRGRNKLLDWAINYAADPWTYNPFLYVVMGIFGGFNGSFANVPYYLKVMEYNGQESRDLWEYNLNLTQEELQRMLRHVWSLGRTVFPYKFFTRNCSYFLVWLLEVARPSMSLLNQYYPGWTLPSDTTRWITWEPDLVESVEYRPSAFSKVVRRYESMNEEQKELFQTMLGQIDERNLTDEFITEMKSMSKPAQAELIDASMDYLSWKSQLAEKDLPPIHRDRDEERQAERIKDKKERFKITTQLLPIRADIDHDTSNTLQLSAEQKAYLRPDAGHKNGRVSLYPGFDSTFGPFFGVQYRMTFHGLNDPERGYPSNAEVVLYDFRVRQYFNKGLVEGWRIERADLMRMIALRPISLLQGGLSWKLQLGVDSPYDVAESCDLCNEGKLRAHVGATLLPFGEFYLYALPGFEVSYSPGFDNNWRLSPGGEAGIAWNIAPRASFLSTFEYFYPVLGHDGDYWKVMAEGRLTIDPNDDWDIRLRFSQFSTQRSEAQLSLQTFF